MTTRTPLTRERIVDAAAAVADAHGLAGVSMRSVGKQLGVEAMSLYHHLAGKEQLLDELADWVFARIRLATPGADWREEMRERARSARRTLSAHPWGLALVESRRTPGPAVLTHHDAVLGCLRRGGFDVRLAAHAFSVLDAYVYGFVLTEQRLPFEAGERVEDYAAELALPAEQYPHLVEMVTHVVVGQDYAYGDEFEHGLELVLDALAARVGAAPGA
ncbi:TetR/AcrR family transcriptional regulator C-terminal domain-containing protein [Cellulomonas phragmiteti]|uniref:Transcriptional regulator, TetR family protein n=1 Tax=Cellulomonas phragmiteti TaxID=478780 RepID=A0ABQ4DMT2_9CELL|nr:TetR/AcrR family transcriptional regulator C-terminal domain-containing protein [Cellulomonas phragmiteti]GIG40658.1 putative transcriptional regulator, TetR family protein [Cellulomonas phragmiteti]